MTTPKARDPTAKMTQAKQRNITYTTQRRTAVRIKDIFIMIDTKNAIPLSLLIDIQNRN